MGGVRLGVGWQSPAAMPRRWLAGVFAVFAVFAALVAIFSSDSVHRLWGAMAACGYGLALVALLGLKTRGRDVALGLSFCGALLVPLAWMAANALEQPEVAVVARSGVTLIHEGTPYAGAAALAATQNPNAYNPYLPLMALFGVPRALLGGGALTDPRVWFGVVFLIVFWLALRAGSARDPGRWAIAVAGSPLIAFELAVGGTDVPMVAFLCLGFAFLSPRYRRGVEGPGGTGGTGRRQHPPARHRRRQPEDPGPGGDWGAGSSPMRGDRLSGLAQPVLAGLALGIGAAMKATAWPAVLVAIALLEIRDGRRAMRSFTLTALAVVAACVGPFAVHARALVENTIMFPLGLASVTSQASSPLPGHLIAGTGHLGHTIVVVALAAAGIAVAMSLVVRPPRTVPRAVVLLAGAMTLMFVLAPSTRFGYFIYPGTLMIWLLAVLTGRAERVDPATPDPGAPPATSRTTRRTSSATRRAA